MTPHTVARTSLVAGVMAGCLGLLACGTEPPSQVGYPSGEAAPGMPALGGDNAAPNDGSLVPPGPSGSPSSVLPPTGAVPNTGSMAPQTAAPRDPAPGVVPGPASPATPAVDEPAPMRLRRLTHVEYDNTIADLFVNAPQLASSFASDVAQDGFTNNASAQSVSPALGEQYLAAAETLSRSATQDLAALLGCNPVQPGEQACVEQFVSNFGKRAWRRPLSAEEQSRLLAVFNQARSEFDLPTSIPLVVQVLLQSPQFLYLVEPAAPDTPAGTIAPLDSWQVASRLSYFLLGSMPDEPLLAAAEAGALSTPEQVGNQARRLLTSPRARTRIGLFFREWLQLRNLDRMQKDPRFFPNYDLNIGTALREQAEYFAQSLILDGNGTGVDLLTASHTFVTPELAEIYGVPRPTTPGFSRVDLNPGQRSGLLTHAGVMASLAKADQTDPVHRGKFVRERLLCGVVPPPPPDAVISPPEISADATTRERFAQHQEDSACAGCHLLMDPIGLGFENFDALGQWRDTENGEPIDATGEVFASDVAGPFDGARELATKLASSREVMNCMAQTWMRFALGRSITGADAGTVSVLGQRFAEDGFDMKELLVALTETQSFRNQRVLDPNRSAFDQEEQP